MTTATPKKEDRRVRKTLRQIEQAFIELMMEKPAQEITVMELSKRADINRGTFYLHYKDIYDLLDTMETQMLCELKETLSQRSLEEIRKDPALKFVDLFQFLYDHRQLSHIVLNRQGDKKLFETAKAALHESAFQTFRTLYGPGDPEEYDRFFTFGLSGCIGLAQQWLSSGCRESASEMGNKCNAYLEFGRSILSTPASGG